MPSGTDDGARLPDAGEAGAAAVAEQWWREAVIYQIYLRSFADGDGDGVGDIAGIRSRLSYLAGLGVDAIWINPWYPSPMADAGYDVSDFRAIEPVFGTLEEASALIAEAHDAGLRVILDVVPNHTSDEHPWFVQALASPPGSAARSRYLFRDGRGPGGDLPPNDWRSNFGGAAWTRVTGPDGVPEQWYLHLFASEQPDLDWTNPEVRADFEHTLRFWFDRGVDGFRIDVAHSLIKAPGLPDVGDRQYPLDRVLVDGRLERRPWTEHPHWDRDDVHDVYRAWRAVADSYDQPRVFVAEAWVDEPERLTRYLRPDELHTAFNFPYLVSPWTAADFRQVIEETLAGHALVGAPATWVLSNHDVARHASRYAREAEQTTAHSLDYLLTRPADHVAGVRRARAAALLTLGLPGNAYVYQGEELGLPEVEDLPEWALTDPTWERSGHTQRGRDGCRVPIPWTADGTAFGFSPPTGAAVPWLPQPPGWGALAVAAQAEDPGSTLWMYRRALAFRREHLLAAGPLQWLDLPAGVLGFRRGLRFSCLVNFTGAPVPLSPGDVVVSSAALTADGSLPPDTAAWLVS